MVGGIIMAVLLLLFPILVAIGGAFAAALLGTLLDRDAAKRFEGSELVELNR